VKTQTKQIFELNKPYHARIFRLYLGYLRDKENWSDQKVQELLTDLQVDESRLKDDSTWFDLDFADRFYQLVKERSSNNNIAYLAGLYMKKNAFSASIYYLMRGLVSVGHLYRLVSKFTPFFTKASHLNVLKMKGHQALIESVPVEPSLERPYMCENRTGLLKGLPQVLNLPIAELKELECFHKGGKRCLYQLKWKEKTYIRQITVSLLLSTIFILSTLKLLNFQSALFSSVIFILSLGYYILLRQRWEQREELVLHNEVLDSAVQDIERKNRELELISHISKLTHALTSPEKMTESVVKNVCSFLHYDRAILLTCDRNRQLLEVQAHYGFSPEMDRILSEAEFNIRSENNTGFFIKVVNTKQPVFIEDIALHMKELSPRSRKFAQILGAKSFVAVPLLDQEGQVLGVLSVDYVDDTRKMKISDQDLLMMLADHLAIAIHNAKILDELERSLEISRRHSIHQQSLSRVFKKFVPTDLANVLMNNNDENIQKNLLRSVRKKSVAIMFSDIFNFTGIAQNIRPEQVVELLNLCFSDIEPIISKYEGFIDKFMGDGFIAIFEGPEACQNSTKAATEFLLGLEKTNDTLKSQSLPEIAIGVGIHYGPVILGNVGSQDRLSFTVIGEVVNLAARLESHTRNLGPNTICTSSAIRANTQSLFEWKSLGGLHLKGYSDEIEAWQLLLPEKKNSLEDKKSDLAVSPLPYD